MLPSGLLYEADFDFGTFDHPTDCKRPSSIDFYWIDFYTTFLKYIYRFLTFLIIFCTSLFLRPIWSFCGLDRPGLTRLVQKRYWKFLRKTFEYLKFDFQFWLHSQLVNKDSRSRKNYRVRFKICAKIQFLFFNSCFSILIGSSTYSFVYLTLSPLNFS